MKEKFIPSTIEEAVKHLAINITDGYKYLLKGMREEEVQRINLGDVDENIPPLGTIIRNTYDLNSVTGALKLKQNTGISKPYDLSQAIIVALRKDIINRNLPQKK